MKKLLGLILLVVLFGCGGVRQAEVPVMKDPVLSSEELHKRAGEYTVALIYQDPDNNLKAYSYCTGVWISKTEIITAAHCIRGYVRQLEGDDAEDAPAREPFATTYKYVVESENRGINHNPSSFHYAGLSRLDEELDLALLQVKLGAPEHKYALISDDDSLPGTRVVLVGHPRGMYWTHMEGTVSANHKDLPTRKSGPFVLINGSVYFGNSGGGAFDKYGHLIGIASFLPPVPNMAVYVGRAAIVRFLE